jgi:hypothetical protein
MGKRLSDVAMISATFVLAAILGASSTDASEKFKRLTGVQIQAKFAGMEMSDDVHWRDLYDRNGTVKSQSMGKHRVGKWWIANNELCVDLGKDSGGCYQVWVVGKKVEFRREGLDSAILDGTLQSPRARN